MNIAVLGTGSMGKTHASIYKSFEAIESVTILGRDKEKTKSLANELEVKGTTDLSVILQDKSITALDVCMPTHLHKQFVIQALESNKHVFCEVPISHQMICGLLPCQ